MMGDLIETIRSNLERVKERIAEAALAVGRQPESIRLVVVTKGQRVMEMQAAAAAGAKIFGENYVQETEGKKAMLTGVENVAWHMIGHIQSRKAEIVAQLYDMVHSVDSLKLAGKLDMQARQMGRILPALIEVNLGGEESKFGFTLRVGADRKELVRQITGLLSFENLKICGLMSMPPLFDSAEMARPLFRRLRELRDTLEEMSPGIKLPELSIGTSMDFEIAIEEGATLVRIGQAIMGPRFTK